MKLKTIHVPEMDYLRAFAILAVLAIHVFDDFERIPYINSLVIINVGIKNFSMFAVPLFLFISGFLLYLKYNKDYSLKEFYLKRFWRVIPPYLIFTTFYIVLKMVVTTIDTGVFTIPSFLSIIYTYISSAGYYHLWFFLIIIELYFVYPVMVKLYHFFAGKGVGILFLVLSLVLQTCWQIFGEFFQLHILGYDLSITNKIFLCRVFYFALGIYVCNHYPKIKEWVLKKSIFTFVVPTVICTIISSSLCIIGILVYGSYNDIPNGSYRFYDNLLLPFFMLFTFAFLFILSNKLTKVKDKMERYDKEHIPIKEKPHKYTNMFTKHTIKWLSVISLYSFGIYLIHPAFIVGIIPILQIVDITYESVVYYPILFSTVLVMSMVFVYIVRKLPFHKYIIG